MKGLNIEEDNALGFCVVRCHYSCDPDRSPDTPHGAEWLEKQRRLYADPGVWEQEMELNFFVGPGPRVFPQFSSPVHNRKLDANTRKVIYRGWDFGWHAPVCLIAQIDQKDRLLILKEIVGAKQTTQDFASSVVKKCAEWWPYHAAGFEDYCDPAGQQVKAMENEKGERRDVEVLNGLGIYPRYEYGWSRKDARSLVHRLLVVRGDGTPGLYVDEAGAPLTSQAFLGQYVYPTTIDGRIKDEPDDLTHPWADVMAAVRYLTIGLQARLGLARFALATSPIGKQNASAFHGYGTPARSR